MFFLSPKDSELFKLTELYFENIFFITLLFKILNLISFICAFSFLLDCYPLSLTHQRLQLLVVRQVKLSHKVIEMLVASIDVSLSSHLAHTVKVVDVDVDKHPEQTRQNLLSHLHEGLREGST